MKSLTKILIISFIGLIISLGLVLFLVRPIVASVGALKDTASIKKTELKALQDQIEAYKNSQAEFAKINSKDLIAGSLLKREDLQNAITEIEAAAAQSGATEALTIQDDITAGASPIQVVEGKVGLDEVSFTLNTSSNFTQLLTFLKYLEHLPHFTEISKISIQSTISPTSSSVFAHSDTINTVIDGVFFVQKP